MQLVAISMKYEPIGFKSKTFYKILLELSRDHRCAGLTGMTDWESADWPAQDICTPKSPSLGTLYAHGECKSP